MYLVFGRQGCFYCDTAKMILDEHELDYHYVDVTSGDAINDNVYTKLLVDQLDLKKLPQVFKLVGGYTELHKELNNV